MSFLSFNMHAHLRNQVIKESHAFLKMKLVLKGSLKVLRMYLLDKFNMKRFYISCCLPTCMSLIWTHYFDPISVFTPSGSLGKTTEKPSSKEKEKTLSDSGSKEGSDKRKRNRVTEKVLNANSNPSSPSAAKRRRT